VPPEKEITCYESESIQTAVYREEKALFYD
jgi:hypothetical protein